MSLREILAALLLEQLAGCDVNKTFVHEQPASCSSEWGSDFLHQRTPPLAIMR